MTTPRSDEGPAASQSKPSLVENVWSRPTSGPAPETAVRLAKEAASMVAAKTLAQTSITGPSTAHEMNRTRLRETGTAEAAEAVEDARQSTGGSFTSEVVAWCEGVAADDPDFLWHDDDDNDDGGGGGGFDSGWASPSPTSCGDVRDGHQQHHHHHYHHDHHHRQWHPSGSPSLSGLTISPCSTPCDRHDEPSAPAPNEYHHHHHHHHHQHHYYHFRGSAAKGPSARPASYPSQITDIVENKTFGNNDSDSTAFKFQETSVKKPRLTSKIKNLLHNFGSNGKNKTKNTYKKSHSEEGSNNTESCQILDNYLKQKTDEDESKHVDNIQKDAMLELARTEKEYVANLSLIVKGYMAFMEDPATVNCSIPVPEDLKINSDKYKLIFVNIKQIYECHRDVCLPALKLCLDKPQEFNGLLQKFDDVLKMYTDFFKKIHTFEYLVYEYKNYFEEMQNFLGYDLPLSSIMTKPLQRIMKYNDIFRDIFKGVQLGKLKIDTEMMQQTIDNLNKLIKDFDEIRIADKVKNVNENLCEKARRNLEGLMREFVDIEERYVNYLGLVVNDYMAVMADPNAADCKILFTDLESISSVRNLVFGNIRSIYIFHRETFLPGIKKYITQPQELQKVFKKLHSNIYLYTTYCQTRNISTSLMSRHKNYFEEIRQKFGHNLQLPAILIKPVQRIVQYKLLLENMLECMKTVKMHDEMKFIRNAIDTMSNSVEEVDKTMMVNRLIHYNGDITNQGSLLMYGVLQCAKNNQVQMTFKDLFVFLFDKTMIFTVKETVKRHSSGPKYYYKDQILLNHMELDDKCNEVDGSFVISSTDSSGSPVQRYICRPVPEVTGDMRFEWFKKLQSLQNAKNIFEKKIMNPLYDKH